MISVVKILGFVSCLKRFCQVCAQKPTFLPKQAEPTKANPVAAQKRSRHLFSLWLRLPHVKLTRSSQG